MAQEVKSLFLILLFTASEICLSCSRNEYPISTSDVRLVAIEGYNEQEMSNIEISSKTVEISSERNDLECNIPDLPAALTGPEVAVTDDSIVVCGGTSVKTPSRRQKKCYQLTKPTDEWKPFPEMKTERYRFHMIYLNEKIWAVGGWAMDNGNWKGLNSMDIFDFNSMRWTNQSIPLNIYFQCLSKIDEFKFILTGGTNDQSSSAKTWIFDTRSNNWEEGPRMENARSSHSCFSVHENQNITKVVVIGGVAKVVTENSTTSSSLSSAEMLNLQTLEWNEIPSPFSEDGNVPVIGVESVVPQYLGFSVGNFIKGLKQVNNNEYEWEKLKNMNNLSAAVVNAPKSLFPSCQVVSSDAGYLTSLSPVLYLVPILTSIEISYHI